MLEHITEALAAEMAARAVTPEQVRAFIHPIIALPPVMPMAESDVIHAERGARASNVSGVE